MTGMKIHTKIWLEDDEGNLLLGEGRLGILKAIERLGSISAAAREWNMSYRSMWGKIRTMEERLSVKLVETASGGSTHGGTELTSTGKRIVEHFERLDQAARKKIDELGEETLSKIAAEITDANMSR